MALACQRSKVSRQTAYRTRSENQVFAEAWNDALQSALDELEGVCFSLARRGNEQLLTWLLRCHRPSIYRDTQRTEHALLGKILILPAKAEGDE